MPRANPCCTDSRFRTHHADGHRRRRTATAAGRARRPSRRPLVALALIVALPAIAADSGLETAGLDIIPNVTAGTLVIESRDRLDVPLPCGRADLPWQSTDPSAVCCRPPPNACGVVLAASYTHLHAEGYSGDWCDDPAHCRGTVTHTHTVHGPHGRGGWYHLSYSC